MPNPIRVSYGSISTTRCHAFNSLAAMLHLFPSCAVAVAYKGSCRTNLGGHHMSTAPLGAGLCRCLAIVASASLIVLMVGTGSQATQSTSVSPTTPFSSTSHNKRPIYHSRFAQFDNYATCMRTYRYRCLNDHCPSVDIQHGGPCFQHWSRECTIWAMPFCKHLAE